jgi:tetratricopeptide (TPR) repeat protein
MSRFLFLLLILAGRLQSPTPDVVASTLARAQALYIEARFKESLDLLAPLDASMNSQTGRIPEKIDIKLQLALAQVGLSQTSEARRRFTEICSLDPNYSLDRQKFSARVISLFDEAKAEQVKALCQKLCAEADRLLDNGDAEGLLRLIESNGSKCDCVQAAALDAATYFSQQGVEAYRQDDMPMALRQFRLALRFQPDNDLARSYIDLSQNRLKVAADQLLLEWRRYLDARDFALAAATYRRLASSNIEGSANDALEKARAGYRQYLSSLVDSWKKACAANDDAAAQKIRTQANEVVPDPAIGRDLLSDLGTCVRKPCVQLAPEEAITRLRFRRDAKLPPGMPPRRVTVQVKIRIDEKGNVTVRDPQSVDAKMRNAVFGAVTTWKFLPAVINNETRCVETEVPMVFIP